MKPDYPSWRPEYARAWRKKYYEANKDKIKAATKKYREENQEKCSAYSNARYHRIRAEVLEHYGGRCACCGEAHAEFLAIDHINGGGVKHIRAIHGQLSTWIKKNGYPEGFRVLCHNCNMAMGLYGHCPHGNLEK